MGQLQEQCARLQEAAERLWADTEDTQVSMVPGSAEEPLMPWFVSDPGWRRRARILQPRRPGRAGAEQWLRGRHRGRRMASGTWWQSLAVGFACERGLRTMVVEHPAMSKAAQSTRQALGQGRRGAAGAGHERCA